jgi:hypothetical protein
MLHVYSDKPTIKMYDEGILEIPSNYNLQLKVMKRRHWESGSMLKSSAYTEAPVDKYPGPGE